MAGLLITGVALASTVPPVNQPDSSAYVGLRWNGYLPAFKDANGVSIPFMPTFIRPPIDYQGDFYVNEFSDYKIKQAWKEFKVKDPDGAKKILTNVSVNMEYRFTGSFDPNKTVNGNDDLKLTDIRRPMFFGQSPYFEDIAKVDKNTYIVEFTVPRGFYEQSQLKQNIPIKLRGWFIKGKGVTNAKGKTVHSLIIFNIGVGGQIFAIQHPKAPYFMYNIQTKQYEKILYPNKNFQTEQWGSRQFRQFLYSFNQSGFDVLVLDKRGHGISGGINGYDSAEMAEDIFRMLDQLDSGEGLTVLTPAKQLLQGKQVAHLLLRDMPAKQVPVLIGGESLGSIITCFAMQKNFIGWTAFNEPGQKFSPAKKYNIKAALLLGDFVGGLGYVSSPNFKNPWGVYEEAALRVEKYTMRQPTSEILANIDKWPGVFFGKGLWDNYESAEGTYEAYHRAKGLKKLIFFRGSHAYAASGTKNLTNMINMMTEFAIRAVVNPSKNYPELKSFREAVLSSPPCWEPTSRP
jgi:hypothetical protein